MKKVLSVFLCLVLLLLTSSVAFAQQEKQPPVLIVNGVNTCDLLLDGESVFPPASSTITGAIKKAVFPTLKSIVGMKGWKDFADTLCTYVNEVVEPVKMNPDGTSKYDVYVTPENSTDREIYEKGEYYTFSYDWRYSPIIIADLLKDDIDQILENTGCDKISLVSHSMGTCVTMSYLYKYGHDKIEKLLFADGAFQGMDFLGDLFTGNMNIDPDYLSNFLDYQVGKTNVSWLSFVIDLINIIGITDGLCFVANDIVLKNTYEYVAEDIFDFIFQLPCMWAFCPYDYYEDAKLYAFGEEPDAKFEKLIEKNDEYAYNVQSKIGDILDACMADGIELAITCGYDMPTVPVVKSSNNQGDVTIDTKRASIGATCSDYTKTFEDGYVQKVPSEKNYVSPDMMIDASTCMYPDQTWFIKHQEHPFFRDGLNEFYDWFFSCDTQPTVFDNEEFPQFLSYDGGDKVSVVGEEKAELTFIQRVLAWLEKVFDAIYGVFDIFKR